MCKITKFMLFFLSDLAYFCCGFLTGNFSQLSFSSERQEKKINFRYFFENEPFPCCVPSQLRELDQGPDVRLVPLIPKAQHNRFYHVKLATLKDQKTTSFFFATGFEPTQSPCAELSFGPGWSFIQRHRSGPNFISLLECENTGPGRGILSKQMTFHGVENTQEFQLFQKLQNKRDQVDPAHFQIYIAFWGQLWWSDPLLWVYRASEQNPGPGREKDCHIRIFKCVHFV